MTCDETPRGDNESHVSRHFLSADLRDDDGYVVVAAVGQGSLYEGIDDITRVVSRSHHNQHLFRRYLVKHPVGA